MSKSYIMLKEEYHFSLILIKGGLSGQRIFGNSKPYRNDEKYFLFHTSFSKYLNFVLTVWSCRKQLD